MNAQEIHNELCEQFEIAKTTVGKYTYQKNGLTFTRHNTYDQRENQLVSAKVTMPGIGFKFEIKKNDLNDIDRIEYVYEVCKIAYKWPIFQNLCRKEKADPGKVMKLFGQIAAQEWAALDIHNLNEVKRWFDKYAKDKSLGTTT